MRRTQYLLAFIAPAIAAAAAVAYGQASDGGVLYGTFAVAVFVVAIYGGFGPGLAATCVSLILALALYGNALGLFTAQPQNDVARLAVLLIAGLVASLLGGQVRRERGRSEAARLAEMRAHRASEEALVRLSALQSLTVDLSRSLTTGEIADAVVRHGRRALAASGGVVYVVSEDRRALDLVAADGYAPDVLDRFGHLPLDAVLPVPVVAREGAAVFVGDPKSFETRFPEAAGVEGRPPSAAMAMVPFRAAGDIVGVMGWTFATPQTFDEDRRTFILTVSGLCGQAMERARAYEAERASRERADVLIRQQAERAAELRSIISAIGEGLLVVGAAGDVRSMNASAAAALGGPVRDRDEIIRRLRLDGEALPPAGAAFGPVEYQLTDRPGTWVELTAYIVEPGTSRGPGMGIEDAMSADLSQPGQPVEGPTTVWLVRDVSAFRQGQRLREAFLSLLSHELRTPVTTIYAAANVLGRTRTTMATEVRQDILEDIVGESNRLYRLVEDLLVLARFDEGLSLGNDPILVQHLVRGVVDSERLRWPSIRFEVEVRPQVPTVSGDETSIQQVLRNLLSNAAKYSPGGDAVLLRVEPEADGAAVRVLDEGIGVRSDEMEHLFDPFYRSPATAKMAGGAGIGLYVCRRLVEAMGGRVWARPREERGSEFGFWLPPYEEPLDGVEAVEVGATAGPGPAAALGERHSSG